MALALRQRNIRRSLACPICQKLFRQVTTIEECCHRFCHKCITKKITEEGLHNCPVCNVDLGSAPLQRLRVDYRWQKILDEFNNERIRENMESGFLKEITKSSQISKPDTNGFDVNMTTEASSRTRTSLRNEKQKYLVDPLTSEKMRGTWRAQNETMWGESYSMLGHVEGKEAKYLVSNIENAASNQFRDLRARRREEKNPIISTSRGSRNSTQIVSESNNVRYNEKLNIFWFSLVASDNQRCKAPLDQIPSRYLRVKDRNITVSSIKKYLMQKLNLRSENEVEISLQGRLLLPNLQICKLVDLWLRTTAPLEKKKAFVGSSARDFVLTLTYSRRPMSA